MTSLEEIPFVGEAASLMAALIWAFSMVLYTGPAARIHPTTLNLYKNSVALFFLFLLTLFVTPAWPQDLASSLTPFVALGVSGLVGITLGDSAFFAALRHLGPQLTSALQCLAPPLSALLALVYYRETLTLFQVIGLVVTTAAVLGLILTRHQGRPKRPPAGSTVGQPSVIQRDWRRGIFWALVAALCQALGIVIARYSLQEMDSTVGTLARLIPAIAGLLLVTFVTSRSSEVMTIVRNRKLALRLTVAAFLASFLGLMLLSIGAKYAKAGITTALSSTYPLWVIPLTRFFLKEPTDARSIGWTVVAVVGIVIMMQT